LKKELFKSISSGYILFFLNSVVAIFLTPYILKYVSKEEYGLYILCLDYLAWFSFLQFGTNKVIEVKAAHQIAMKDYKALNISFNSSFFFQALVALLIIPLFYFPLKANIISNEVSHLNTIIFLFSISAGISVFRSLYSAVIIATKKIYLDNNIQIGLNILNYILIIVLIPYIKVLGLAYISLFVVALILIRSHFRIRQLVPTTKVSFEKFDLGELKDLLSTGIYFTMGSLATILLVKIDSFIIGRELGLETIASFYITVKIFILLQKIFNIFLNNFRPHIAQLFAEGKFGRLNIIFNYLNSFCFATTLLIASILMMINEWFVDIWVGSEFYLGSEFCILFGFAVLLEILTIPSRIALTSSLFDIKYQGYFRAFEAIFRILGIFLLYSHYGLNIMPLMSIISSILFGHLYFHFKMLQYFNEKKIKNVNSNAYKLVLLTVIILILYANNLITLFIYVLSIVSVIHLIFLLLKKDEIIKELHLIKLEL